MATYDGRMIVPSKGPRDARIVCVGESPSDYEVKAGEPFVGPAGGYLNLGFKTAAIDRSQVYLMNLVPIQPEGNKFKNHSEEDLQWGLERFEAELDTLKPEIVVALGAEPLKHLLDLKGITKWRGTLFHPEHWPVQDLSDNTGTFIAPGVGGIDRPWPVLPTFHPSSILQSKDFTKIWWIRLDLQRAQKYLHGKWDWSYEDRKWYTQGDVSAFERFVDRVCGSSGPGSHFVAVDTENEPCYIVACANEEEVHAFMWHESFREPLTRLMQHPKVLKAAHNLNHDWTFFTKRLGIDPKYPFVDTYGVAHILSPEMSKALSPGSSTRFTYWPYHKWMYAYDPVAYCGLDTACAADIYWGEYEEVNGLARTGYDLWPLIQFDHRLQEVLMEMQWRGVPIDEGARGGVEEELRDKLNDAEDAVRDIAKPIIRNRLDKFRKPHLFFIQKRCECCHNGKALKEQCWRCAGYVDKPKLTELKEKWRAIGGEYSEKFEPKLKADYENLLLAPCKECEGLGKFDYWKPFNPDSPQQISDVIYRGLGIAPRRYMGAETVRYERLEPIQNRHPLIKQYVQTQAVRADYDTIVRLKPGNDGKLHSILDPFGTTSGRVACKEGLLEPGTNLMNLPYRARRLVKAPEGEFILYPDMEQIEARAVAVLSRDQKLWEVFKSGEDSHMYALNLVKDATGFDMNDVSVGPHAGDGRQFMKRGMYAFMYGIREKHFAGELGISVELAAQILQALGYTFSGVQRWKDGISEEIFTTRHVRTPGLHQRKFLDRIALAKTKDLDYEILKKGLSHKPQDMAARILAEGLLDIRSKYESLLTPLMHVHDALAMTALLERKHEAVKAALECMNREKWGMNFSAGMSVGPNWWVASLKDSDKVKEGYGEWTMEAFLS